METEMIAQVAWSNPKAEQINGREGETASLLKLSSEMVKLF